MKTVWIEEHGGPEVLRVSDRPEPERGPSDVLVEVKACGLNHLDIWVRKGGPRGFPLPLVPGSDAAGVVKAAPEGSSLSPGDEVVTTETAFGTLGLSVCYDLRFPELYRAQVDLGAQMFVVPAAWPAPAGAGSTPWCSSSPWR